MSDSGDPAQDKRREVEAEREHYGVTRPNNIDPLDKILYRFARYARHHEVTGLGGEGINATEAKAAIEQLLTGQYQMGESSGYADFQFALEENLNVPGGSCGTPGEAVAAVQLLMVQERLDELERLPITSEDNQGPVRWRVYGLSESAKAARMADLSRLQQGGLESQRKPNQESETI